MGAFPQAGEIFAKRYELIEVVGTGGLSTVFKARQTETKRSIALKILHEDVAADKDFIKRFLREAKALSQLDHPGIVKVYHLGSSEDGLPFMAMELIRGKNLNQLIKESGPIPVSRALKIIRRCAEALAHIHQNEIVHRDLKPANIGILDKPEADTIKIIDFGLSKFTNEQKSTKTGTVIGSVNYMSPEQCMGKDVDARSDLYSLTLCLYEMITGQKPFSAENPVGMIYQHINTPVPKLTADQVSPFVPELNTFIAKGLAKSADERFASAQEFIAALDKVQDRLDRASEAKAPVTKQDLKYTALGAGICAVLLAGFFVVQKKSTGTSPDISQSHSRTRITLERAIELVRSSKLELWDERKDVDGNKNRKRLKETLDDPKLDPLARACLLAGLAETYQVTELSGKDELLARAHDAARKETEGIKDRLISESYQLSRVEYEKRHNPRALKVFLACGANLAQRLVDTSRYEGALTLIDLLIKVETPSLDSLPQYDEIEFAIHPYTIPYLELLKCKALYGINDKQAADLLLNKLARRYHPPAEVGALLQQYKREDEILKLIKELSQRGDPESLLTLAFHFVGSNQTAVVEALAEALKPFAAGDALRYGRYDYARIELARIEILLKQKKLSKAKNDLIELAEFLSNNEPENSYRYKDPLVTCAILEQMHKTGLEKEAHGFLIANYKSLSGEKQSKYTLTRLVPFADRDADLAKLLKDSGALEESKKGIAPSFSEMNRYRQDGLKHYRYR